MKLDDFSKNSNREQEQALPI